MSELNINDLPREILIKIFRVLNGRILKNATLACKLWNNLIESECRWSLHLFYDKDGNLRPNYPAVSAVQKINFILATNRKFGTITITEGHLSEDNLIRKVFQRHGLTVVKLCLRDCRIDNLIAFAQLLRLIPNLKYVAIKTKNLNCVPDVLMDQVLPDLNKLKTLEMSVNDRRIIKCFRKAKLTTIKIEEDHLEHHYYGPLVDFLASQEMLTSLTFEGYFSSLLDQVGKLDVSFQLTKLAITGTRGISSLDENDHLLRFVKSQAENLAKLKLGFDCPSSVYDCLFASMPKLDTVSLIIDGIPQDNDFYERLKENGNVRTLKMLDYGMYAWFLDDVQFVGNFLKKLPNIRRLMLLFTGYVNKNVLLMAQHLSKLESFYIGLIDDHSVGSIDCVQLFNLKTLHIKDLRGRINWNEFTKVHSRLAELSIDRMEKSYFSSDDIDQITTNVDLQSIRLGIGFVADDRFFEIIRSKCKNLKILDLHKSCMYGTELRENVEINVLRLCDNIIWSEYFE